MALMNLETFAGVAFLALTSFFIIDLHYYYAQNPHQWGLFHGAASFSKWPPPRHLAYHIGIHAIGMLVWMFIVVHQLWTKGKGRFHASFGMWGSLIMIVSLLMSLPAVDQTTIPSLHGMMGITCYDLILPLAVAGIVIETVVSIVKVRSRQFQEHRKHAICAILFSAAPGLYRLIVHVCLATAFSFSR